MSLFLSKLLPLFIYPVGLSCLLLVVALGMLWWQPRRAAIPIALALVLLLLGSNGWVANWLARSLEYQHVPTTELPKVDAIVVLGGCTKPASPPRPWVEVSEAGDRVLYGAKLYRDGKAAKVIVSGGRIEWFGAGPAESANMAELLETMGVPRSAILQDPTSLNTYENGVNVKKILDAQGMRRILLVTSAMHMPRSLLIFKRLGIEAIPAPADFLVSEQDWEELQSSTEAVLLNVLPEAERLWQTSKALKEYIGILVYRLRGWA